MNTNIKFESISDVQRTHFHSQIELIYVVCGESVYTVNSSEYVLTTNNILIIFPYQKHSCDYFSDNCILYSLTFDYDYIHDFSIRFAEYIFNNPHFRSKEINGFTRESIEMIAQLNADPGNANGYQANADSNNANEYQTNTGSNNANKYQANTGSNNANAYQVSIYYNNAEEITDLKQKGYLTVILGDLFFKHELSKIALDSDIHVLLKTEELLKNGHFSIEEISHELGITPLTLRNSLNHVLNISFNTFRNTIKVNYSKELLVNSDMSIIDIGYEAGFNSTQSFFRNFKKATGLSPGEYRNHESQNRHRRIQKT